MYFRSIITILVVVLPFVAKAQFSPSAYIGFGPSHKLHNNAQILTNLMLNEDYRIAPTEQSVTWVGGINATFMYESGFFFASELQYRTSATKYIIQAVSQLSEGNATMHASEREHVLAIPASIGVQLGKFNIHSGIQANFIVSQSNELQQFNTFEDNSSGIFMSWHTGIAYILSPITLEIRYTQDFKNYGAGYRLADEDLAFYGNRNYWLVMVRYNLLANSKSKKSTKNKSEQQKQ
jgi:hypothetical protein